MESKKAFAVSFERSGTVFNTKKMYRATGRTRLQKAGQVMQERSQRLLRGLPAVCPSRAYASPRLSRGPDFPPSAGRALFQRPQRCPAAEKVQNAHVLPGAAPFGHILQRACAGKQKAATHCHSTGALTKVQSPWRAPAECGIMKAVRRGGGPAPHGRYGRARHGAARAENRGLCDGTV